MAYPYIAKADIEQRLSAPVVKRIYDDDNDGTADADPVNRLCKDASARVAGFLRGIYSLDAVAAAPPEEVIRLTLDVAEALAAKRFPRAVMRDWMPLWKVATDELKDLRNGVTRLDVEGSPEPAANQGGEVASGNPDAPDPLPRFSDDWGVF